MFIDIEEYLSHISEYDKKLKMRRIIDKIEMVSRNYVKESTDFLDPYERRLAISILNRFSELKYTINGGLKKAERKIITIFPDYVEAMIDENIDENIEVLRVIGDISDLSHKDFLGAIMNLGISRNKIGDILLYDDYTDIICKSEISDFIILNLEKVGNKNVKISRSSIDQLTPIQVEFKEIFKIITSLRLDTYISACYNLSRNNSMKIIKSNKVKVNWQPIDKISYDLSEDDTISVRGYGRSILYSTGGFTKKGNIKATIRILI